MKRQPKPITTAQIRHIHTLTRVLGLDDESYRAVIARLGQGVESSKDLTQREASAVIRELQAKAGIAPTPKRPAPQPVTTDSRGNIVALPTPGQVSLINVLITEVQWHQNGGFSAWLRANMGLERVQTKEQAQRVINGLKALKRHGHTRRTGA